MTEINALPPRLRCRRILLMIRAFSLSSAYDPMTSYKPLADSLVDGIPASGLTSTLQVGTGTDRVRISEPSTPSFRVVSIRDAHNFSGRAIRFVSNRH